MLVVAVAGCGGGANKATTSASNTGSRSQAYAQLAAATGTYNAALHTFLARYNADAPRGNVPAVKADFAQLRDTVFTFDSAVRKISFPPQFRRDVNSLLQQDSLIISDLESIRAATSVDEINRLHARENVDDETHRTAADKLLNELR